MEREDDAVSADRVLLVPWNDKEDEDCILTYTLLVSESLLLEISGSIDNFVSRGQFTHKAAEVMIKLRYEEDKGSGRLCSQQTLKFLATAVLIGAVPGNECWCNELTKGERDLVVQSTILAMISTPTPLHSMLPCT